jgi:DNA helicase-2/ATP-dependent DNA helicase PcrA
MNYRSQQLILDAAGKLISNNRETVTRYIPEVQTTLTAAKEYQESKIDLVKYPTNDEEEYEVARRVKQLIDKGIKPEQIAVLGRYNRDVEEVADRLNQAGVPVRNESGINALRETRVRQFKKLLEWVVDSLNEEVVADVLQYDWWPFKPLDVLKLLHFAGQRGKGILATVTNLGSLKEAGVEQPELFIEWAKQAAKWKRLAANMPLMNLFDELLHDTGLLTHLEHDSNGIRELKALSALFGELKRMSLAKPDLTLKEFIARLSLMDENNLALTTEVVSASSRAVRIMTAHKAKGLEFEYVFIVRLVDKHWGNQRSRTRLALPAGIVKFDPVLEQENNEDERRLFYVALTRAKRQLVWSYAQFDDKGREQLPSQFLNEVESDLIEDNFVTSDDKVKERWLQMRTKKVVGMKAEDIREWAEQQLKKYVMSVTHLNNYLECPRLFYYRNFLRVPAAKNKHMAFGTAAHAALFDLWQTTKQNRKKVDKEYLFTRFKWHLQREVLSSKDRQDCGEMGQKVLQQYFEYYGIPSAKKYELEYSFRRHGVTVDDLQLTGQLDRIEYLSDNQVKVIDYKTGNPDSAYKESRPGGKYHRQLVFYKLLCDESKRFNQRMVSGELDFIQPSIRQGKFIRLEYQVVDKEVEKIKETIKQVWIDIKSLRFMSRESGCGQCDYCLADEQRTGG